MYTVAFYFSERLKKNYKSIEEIVQDFQFLEKPIKEGFYRDIFTGDLMEIDNFEGKYNVINHMLINKINFKNLEDVYQNFQLKEKPLKEGFYRDMEGNLIEITKEDV